MMIWYINCSYQLNSLAGPEEKGLKGGRMQPMEGSDGINKSRVCSSKAVLLSDSCNVSEEQVWYIRQYMTKHKHHNNLQGLRKKRKKNFPCTYCKRCMRAAIHPCALSWRQEANQMRCIPYSCDLWLQRSQNHIFADCQWREWVFCSSN